MNQRINESVLIRMSIDTQVWHVNPYSHIQCERALLAKEKNAALPESRCTKNTGNCISHNQKNEKARKPPDWSSQTPTKN